MGQPDGADTFPAPVYRETVLAPLFEGAKRHHWRQHMRVNRASAVMLATRGLLTREEAGAILRALDAIDTETDLAALAYTGQYEDVFFLVEAGLRQRLGIETAGKLHTGRSRNDIDHTVFKMALKDRLAALLDDLLSAVGALLDVAEANRATLVVAYTHGQPAQPTTYGHYLGAVIELLLRDVERLRQASRYPDLSSMGAAAITTSGFPLDRDLMAELLGFAGVQENSYGCIAANDYVTAVYGPVRLLFVHLGRFVQDLNTWTGFEVGHLKVPDGFVQVSSIMPQKRNPVAVEHLRLLCSLAAGRAGATADVLHNTPFTDVNDAEGEVQVAGYAAFEAGGRALRLLAGFIRAARVDEARVRRHIEESCITATELADSLVRAEGLSFRQAHEVVSRMVRVMLDAGQRFATVPYRGFADAFAGVVGRPPRLGEADFRRYTTPEHFIAVRALPGGPAPAPLAAALARYRAELEAARAWLAAYRARMDGIDERLTERALALLTSPGPPGGDEMIAGSEELATRFEQAVADAVATVRGCDDAAWQSRTPDEGWTVAATAHHAAQGIPFILGMVEALAGDRPLPPFDFAGLDQRNAEHAQAFAAASREETIALLLEHGPRAARSVRGLSPADLDRSSPPLPIVGTMTARQFIERGLIGHITGHLASIARALGK